MNPICWLLLGLIAGAVAQKIVPSSDGKGTLGNIFMGIAGAFFGGFFALFYVHGHLTLTLTHLSVFGLALAVMGAMVSVFVWQAVKHIII